jgi:ribosomal protein L18E
MLVDALDWQEAAKAKVEDAGGMNGTILPRFLFRSKLLSDSPPGN